MTDYDREREAVKLLNKLARDWKLAEQYGSSGRRCMEAIKCLHAGTPFKTAWTYIAGLSLAYLPDPGPKQSTPDGWDPTVTVSPQTLAILNQWAEECGYTPQAYLDTLVRCWPKGCPPPTPMFAK